MMKVFKINCTTYGKDIRTITMDKVFSTKEKAQDFINEIRNIKKKEENEFNNLRFGSAFSYIEYTINEIEVE